MSKIIVNQIESSDGTTDVLNTLSAVSLGGGIAGAGKVLQVVNVALQDGVTTTSNTFVDSPLSAAITPTAASSKIKISYHVIGGSSNGVGVPLRIKRDIGGTTAFNILTAGSDGSQPAGEATTYYTGYGGSSYVGFHMGIECLDTPNTTN